MFGIFHGIAQSPVAPQSRPAPAAAPAATAEQESAPAKDDASHQGVKVHGHWKIVVKNPDGSVAQTREFENSLTAGGALYLGQLLVGESQGQFGILLTTTGSSICPSANCTLVPTTSAGIGIFYCGSSTYTCFPGMTTTLTGPPTAITLAGQMTAAYTGTITNVATYAYDCKDGVAPPTCAAYSSQNLAENNPINFTATTVSAIAVNAGQIVQVTVTISFS
jgi:hypothetical protein